MTTHDVAPSDLLLFDDLSMYTIDPLSPEKEIEMIKLWQDNKSEWAKDQIYRANLRFVIDIAGEYKGGALSFSVLISCGTEGLGEAMDRFDTERGYKFITYAVWWIRQRILYYLRRENRNIRVPDSRINDSIALSAMREKMTAEIGRFPSNDDLLKNLGWTAVRFKNAMLANSDTFSLDAPIIDGKDSGLHEVIADDNQDQLDTLADGDMNDWIRSRIDQLDHRCRMIITRYFGIDGEEPETLEQIGDTLGVTRERVRQLKERSLIQMRGEFTCSDEVIG